MHANEYGYILRDYMSFEKPFKERQKAEEKNSNRKSYFETLLYAFGPAKKTIITCNIRTHILIYLVVLESQRKFISIVKMK